MHALVISVLLCTSYSLGRESKLLVERTVDLSSFPDQSVKVQLAGWYTQKNKYSPNTAVLRALVLKIITVPQDKLLVQLGISYRTRQNIRCAFDLVLFISAH